jgi:L-ascorbate metabolism protein UlaG (beta-lactamase superfamily)
MGRATMDLDEAVEATISIQPKKVIPMHRRDTNPEEFKMKVEKRSSVHAFAIIEGEEIEL